MARRVVLTDFRFPDADRERAVAERHGAELRIHQCTSAEETAEALRGADVALVNMAPVTRAALAGLAPGATVIRYGVGVDNVDVAAATELGVKVANVPDYGVDTVADHATACLLALLRRLPAYDRAVRERGWCRPSDLGPLPGLKSTTVGLIGTGNIGLAVADRLRGFGLRLLAHDPYADPAALAERGLTRVDLPELLAESHAVSLHVPATAETRHLLNPETIAWMRPGAFVVNTSRGAVIDTDALVEALRSGQVGGAALDVFDPEPPPPDSPLRTLPNVLLTPHVAFYSEDAIANLQRLAAEEADRALAGRPLRRPVT